MQKHFFILVISILLFSCKAEKKSDSSTEPVMQKQSEMSTLMLKMYEENQAVKQKIIKGEDLMDFPEEYLKIHTAVLTDPTDRTTKFNAFSDIYVNNQRILFEISKDSAKAQFNQTVNSCIACHQSFCPGPITRIKKLLIQ